VNKFQTNENLELERLVVDPIVEQTQKNRLTELRKNRDAVRVSELLEYLDKAARSADNLMPIIIECVENDITLGEVCNTLRHVWGEYQSTSWI